MHAVLTLLIVCCVATTAVFAAEIDCTGEGSLSAFISCVKSSIQPKDSEMYNVVSDESTHALFSTLIQNITSNKKCEILFPTSIASIFKSKYYVEDGTTYCLIYTYQDANDDGYFDDGHGVYIINMGDNPTPVSVVVPHPLYDTNTPALGIGVFSSLKGHVFSIAGAHRHANAATSSCQSSYKEADSVHNIDNFFLTFHEAIFNVTGGGNSNGALSHIQFHSMGASTCPEVDVFISSGFSAAPAPSSPAATIFTAASALHPDWNISHPAAENTNGCNLYGTSNTIGRMMHGVATVDICTTAADSSTALASSVFVQVELKWDYRSATDWIPIMTAAFLAPTVVPSSAPSAGTDKNSCTPFSVETVYRQKQGD